MMIVFRCMFVVCLIPCFVSAELPKAVAERFAAAQDSIDNEEFRGSYSLSILSRVKKPGDDPGETNEMEWDVTVDPTGEEARRLERYTVDGKDVTEKKRKKFEGRTNDADDDEEADEGFLSPFGEHADSYLFGSPQVIGDRIEISFEPARGHEEEKGITRGSMAWGAASLDPLWLAMEILDPPKPVRELKMRLEFERVGTGVYLKRMVTDGRAKVLLMKRDFHMEMTVSNLAPAGLEQFIEPVALLDAGPDAFDRIRIAPGVGAGVPTGWAGERGGEGGGLVGAEVGGGDAEIAAGGGFDSVDGRAELNDVEVEIEDSLLAQMCLELASQDRLADLAKRRSRRSQPQVLGQLLGDG